ncbi:MAG: 1-(5-phosphoribosyl)-5-amino-4-imidazole-carboxylate carboxylase, partial [Gammaproteobacteria bacterium]|nr:1-(5-phosphoribosyl)-5-amino-4-imidazole-carboxylate carboxylase [Gammaproteobacteria bacterium]
MTAFARLDHDRIARQGLPEVVFADGKTPDQVAAIMAEFAERAGA